MLIASRALGVASSTGSPLPEVPVLAPLYQQGVVIRQGQLVMIAGPSGGGKSTLAQYIAAMMDVPTLYFAADMQPDDSIPRLVATLIGIPVDEVRDSLSSYGMFLEDCKIQFSFQENPEIDDIYLELDAYVEAWDAWPQLIVIDNLMDIDLQGEGQGWNAQQFIMQELRNLAKRTQACVVVLAHTQSKEGSDYSKPQSRDKILNKIDQKPQVIFTLGREGDLFRIATVKDRNSAATDSTAKRYITIMWQGETASFSPCDADWARYAGVGL